MDIAGPEIYAVILAGGSGTRFWPKSRHKSPKQLCAIGDASATMIEVTLNRLDGFIPPDRRIIVTHQDQLDATKQLVGTNCGHFIAEPEAKNTGAALTLAALEIQRISGAPDPIMISLHADHTIANLPEFLRVLEQAVSLAKENLLVLVGIKPTRPDTGFGYIEMGPPISGSDHARKVASFNEKPNLERAKTYLNSGQYCWNSGIFVWKVETLRVELEKFMPKTLATLTLALEKEGKNFSAMGPDALRPYYSRLDKIAIDNGVLEKSSNVGCVSGDFGWQDIGTWAALDECFPTDSAGNLSYGDVLLLDTKRSTVDTDGPFIAVLGVTDLVVVCAKGAVLVCTKDRAQDVKQIVEHLTKQSRDSLL
jgi:mannose-1-phosphate guanylyltransferase